MTDMSQMKVEYSDEAAAAELEPGVIPYLSVVGAAAASDFYQKAFGARELARMTAEDGQRLMHCHLHINGGSVMLSDAFEEYGQAHQPSHSFTMHMSHADVQPWWDRAVAAGCEVVMPLELAFWGDIYGQLKDPYGVRWSLAQPGNPQT